MKSLFLHYGPGGNAAMERAWFTGPSHANTDFWDQPILSGDQAKYANLLKACEKKFDETYSASGQPVNIAGHSFGCTLALSLYARNPQKIKSLKLLAPMADIPVGFYNLAKRLHNDAHTPEAVKLELTKLIQKFENLKPGSSERLGCMWELIGHMVKDPNYLRLYFGNQECMMKYGQIAASKPGLDFAMWQAVLNDY